MIPMKYKVSLQPLTVAEVESKLILFRGQSVILDRDVAALYGVQTKEVNQAVRNNPMKFPDGFVIELSDAECEVLRSKILTLEPTKGKGHHSKYGLKVFTEQGLYMLATILKGEIAARTTLRIVQTFVKVRSLKRELLAMHTETDSKRRNSMMNHFGQTLAEIVMPEPDSTETETSLELNFIIGKLKHTVRRVRKGDAK